MEKPIKRLEGNYASLELFEDRAILYRSRMGRMATGGPNEKTMIYSKLSGVELKKPSFILAGYLQFSGSGLKASNGTLDAAKNENTIMFRNEYEKWEEAAKFINDKISNGSSNHNTVQQLSPADEILKYKNLLDLGVISEEEFQAKKKELLNL